MDPRSSAHRTGSRRRSLRVPALLVLIALVLVGCERRPLWSPTDTSTYGTGVLTREGTDAFVASGRPDRLHVEALARNRGTNTRMLVWPKGVARTVSSESCATWTRTERDLVQQGAAFRITRAGSRVRAVTITQNISFGAYWTFNVHTWDTARARPFALVGQVDLRSWAEGRPLPWTVCARLIGNRAEVKAWTSDERVPYWNDRVHGGAVLLPHGWGQAGQTGWYAGHLRAGQHADFTGLGTWTYDLPAPSRLTPKTQATASFDQLRVTSPPGPR